MQIEQVTYADVAPFAGLAAKERTSISDTKGTEWFLARSKGGEVCGVAGLIKCTFGYRIKGVYVPRHFRGRGIGERLTQFLFDKCDERCAGIEVYAYNESFYTGHGFRKFGVLPNGAVKLRRMW